MATAPTQAYKTTPFRTTTPGPCSLCQTTNTPSELSTTSYNNLAIGLSIGLPCLVLTTVCISLLCCSCLAKRKPAAGTPGPVPPQQGAVSQVYVVPAVDVDQPPVYDQILVFGVVVRVNQGPTASPLPQEYDRPPDYESMPPSYETVINLYKPNENGVVKHIPDPSTRKIQH